MALYFSEDEVRGLRLELVELLDQARGLAKVPFYITSGLRTPEENERVGGAPNSAHLRGLAADLRCQGDHTRYRMIAALYAAGFRRIVVYGGDQHIHVDCDLSLPQDVFVVKP